MASPLGNRKNSKFMAVSTAPSINKTPMGASTPPVPYPVCHDLSNSVGIVPHVKLNGDPAYVLDQTTQSRCTGDEPGTAGGIRSGTVNGEVKPTSASGHVKITGKRVVRVGDTCTLNAGNCPGVYVAAPAPAAPGSSANPPIVPETPAEKAFLEKLGLWWEETKTQLGQAAAHPVEATKGAVKDTLNIIPQLAQLLMQGSALQSAAQMEQAAALQSAFGNSQTASQLHTAAEGVRQSADQINLPRFEMSNPAQEGGAKIAMAAQLATGVAGLAKGGVKLGARGMAKIGVKPAGALEKAAVKIGKTGDGFHVKGQTPGITGKAGFRTMGLDVDPRTFPDGRRLISELERSGLSRDLALRRARQYLESGTTLPEAKMVGSSQAVYKFMPQGTPPSGHTGYWFSESQKNALLKDPGNLAGRAGLPLENQAPAYDVYMIRPRSSATVFESAVAPTAQGSVTQPGGAIQTIVPNRSLFTDPVKLPITVASK